MNQHIVRVSHRDVFVLFRGLLGINLINNRLRQENRVSLILFVSRFVPQCRHKALGTCQHQHRAFDSMTQLQQSCCNNAQQEDKPAVFKRADEIARRDDQLLTRS